MFEHYQRFKRLPLLQNAQLESAKSLHVWRGTKSHPKPSCICYHRISYDYSRNIPQSLSEHRHRRQRISLRLTRPVCRIQKPNENLCASCFARFLVQVLKRKQQQKGLGNGMMAMDQKPQISYDYHFNFYRAIVWLWAQKGLITNNSYIGKRKNGPTPMVCKGFLFDPWPHGGVIPFSVWPCQRWTEGSSMASSKSFSRAVLKSSCDHTSASHVSMANQVTLRSSLVFFWCWKVLVSNVLATLSFMIFTWGTWGGRKVGLRWKRKWRQQQGSIAITRFPSKALPQNALQIFEKTC